MPRLQPSLLENDEYYDVINSYNADTNEDNQNENRK